MSIPTQWSPLVFLLMLLHSVLWALVTVWVFAGGVRKIDYGARWLYANGLVPGPDGAAFARTFAERNLVLRVIGGTAGLFLGAAFDRAMGVDTSAHFGFWAWITSGWMIGAWWADRSIERPGDRGAALLVPRRLSDYLPRTLLAAPTVLAIGVVGIAVLTGWMTNHREAGAPIAATLTPAASMVAVSVSVALVLLTHLMQRSVVSSHQPLMSAELRRIDDTARSTTLHHIAGAGTAAVACVAGYLILVEVQAYERLPFGMRGWLPGIPMIIAVFAWRLLAFVPWRVRRMEPLP